MGKTATNTDAPASESCGLVMRSPFSAGMLPLGAPVWFVQDKFGHNVCQIMPSADEKTAIEMASLLNLAMAVRPYFKSGNSIAVERATILRKDIAEYLDA